MKKHTGETMDHDDAMYRGSCGFGKPDPHADTAYVKNNRAHGMAHGLSPYGQDGGEETAQKGGAGMASNATHHKGG